jgi:hypothetical protein
MGVVHCRDYCELVNGENVEIRTLLTQ